MLSGTFLLFWWSRRCWQIDFWFLCLFKNQLEHLEVHGSSIVEAWLGEFWALLNYQGRWVQIYGSLSIFWHCLSLGLKLKLTFSTPGATPEFSKFAGILSAALSQHHTRLQTPLNIKKKMVLFFILRIKISRNIKFLNTVLCSRDEDILTLEQKYRHYLVQYI